MKTLNFTMRLTIGICFLLVPLAFALGIPHLMNIQGILTDDEGTPVYDGIHMVDFSIYNVESGGAALWSESRAVTATGGLFSVVLGEVNPIPASLFSDTDLWLGMALTGNPEMIPRQRLTTVPYVYRALNADSANFAFTVADDAINSSNIADGSIMLGDLGQNGATSGQVIKWNGSAWAPAIDEGSGGGWVDDGSVVRLASSADKVGIGTSSPQEKLHVNGNIRLNATSSIAFGDDNTRTYVTGGDMVVTADDDLHLQPDDDIYIRKDGGATWVHFDNSTQRLGIGITDPAYKLTVNGELSIAYGGVSKYHINYYNGGLNFAETGVSDRRIHISDGGNVGIGTANPGAKLGINGDLKVNGAFKGNISSATDTDGAPFPRPAYDSGWFEFYTGRDFDLVHNIGGDSTNYVVDLRFMQDSYMGIHNQGIGTDIDGSYGRGGSWYGLTSTMITITPAPGAGLYYIDSARVRIWVIE